MPLPFAVTADTPLSATQLATHTGVQGGASRGFRWKIYRWVKKGVVVNGQTIKLRATRSGGKWLVKWGDYVAFEQACTRAAGVEPTAEMPTPAELRKRADRAMAEIEAMFAPKGRRKAG